MRIHTPEVRHHDDSITISAHLDYDSTHPSLSPELWFTVPAAYAGWLTPRAEPFAATLLTLPMLLNEPLHVEGALSPKLAYGLREIQKIYHAWHPKSFHRVEITADAHQPLDPAAMTADVTLSLFSGGVDSFYTLWSHLPAQEPLSSYRITHALFVHGYDIHRTDTTRYDQLRRQYTDLLAENGVTLIPVQTNIADVMHVHWHTLGKHGYRYGNSYGGFGLLFGRAVSRMLIAGGADFSPITLQPWGTHPLVDHHLSTETLTVYHHGNESNRFQKVAAIAPLPAAQNALRVCLLVNKLEPGAVNCCECTKCLSVMLRLEALDTLHHFPTFHKPLRRDLVRGMWRASPGLSYVDSTLLRQIGEPLRQRNQWGLWFDLAYMTALYRLRVRLRKILGKV